MPRLARHLPLTALRAGMVLAKPLVTRHGVYLEEGLPSGHVLTAACLDKLRRGHTETACVLEHDPRTASQREQEQQAHAARLAQIFRHADLGHRPTRMLHDALLAHRTDFSPLPAPGTTPDARQPDHPSGPHRAVMAVRAEEIADRLQDLPAFPTVVRDVLATIDDEDSHLRTLTDHLEHDPVLGARVLSMANQPHGHMGAQPVADLYAAVTLVGMRRIREVVASVALVDFARRSGCSPSFWQHSLAVAIAAEELATRFDRDRGRALVAGLLHDVGALWLSTCRPDDLDALITHPASDGAPREEVERTVFGMDHAAIGRSMALAWKLPADIANAVRDHHAPRSDAATPMVAITHLAELVCLGLDLPARAHHEIARVSDIVHGQLGAAWSDALPELLAIVQARVAFEVAALDNGQDDRPTLTDIPVC